MSSRQSPMRNTASEDSQDHADMNTPVNSPNSPPTQVPDNSNALSRSSDSASGELSAPPPSLTSDKPSVLPKSRSKRNAFIFIAVLGGLLVLSLLLSLIPFETLGQKNADVTDAPAVTVNPLFFQTPVYDEDFTADQDYMDLDRYLHFRTLSGEEFVINGDAAEHGAVCMLFDEFRQTVVAGDCDGYNALFTDEYLQKKGTASFAPQKLYSLNVTVLRSELLDDGDANGLYKGATVSYCKVEYCIKDNNGTFRQDFYRDGDSIPQIFEILEYNGTTRISQISLLHTASTVTQEKEGFPIMFFVWIAMIVLAVVAEAMTAAITAIWFVPAGIISMILALANCSLNVQIITYFVTALVLLLLSKTILKKLIHKKGYTPTNADRVIGGEGLVTEEINNIAGTGEVKIDGKRWTARTEADVIIPVGSLVTVLRIEGVKLVCKPAEKTAEVKKN